MRFFIACPANLATGGTELLHQLSWHLSNRGIENYMLYCNANPKVSPTEDTFMKYQVKYVTSFIDDEQSVLILPETWAEMADICKRGVIVLWWLSVNGYINVYNDSIRQQDKYDIFGLRSRTNLIHFAQSRYAYDFVRSELNISNVLFLKDYINDEIVQLGKENNTKTFKENICLYNPKRGAQNLEQIKKHCRSDIEWVALQGLTPNQMAALMCRAKVYIDFGTHPGKDRIPREAAVCGCCIITNKEGSAAYAEDVGIPEEYKFSDMKDYDHVLETIYDLIDNYDQKVGNYKTYVTSILNEKKEFEEEIECMLKIVEKMCANRNLYWEAGRYNSLFESMQKILLKISSLYIDSQRFYENKEIDKSIEISLIVDGLLSAVRETNYAIIEDMVIEDDHDADRELFSI